jgi:hypothetical protein
MWIAALCTPSECSQLLEHDLGPVFKKIAWLRNVCNEVYFWCYSLMVKPFLMLRFLAACLPADMGCLLGHKANYWMAPWAAHIQCAVWQWPSPFLLLTLQCPHTRRYPDRPDWSPSLTKRALPLAYSASGDEGAFSVCLTISDLGQHIHLLSHIS